MWILEAIGIFLIMLISSLLYPIFLVIVLLVTSPYTLNAMRLGILVKFERDREKRKRKIIEKFGASP